MMWFDLLSELANLILNQSKFFKNCFLFYCVVQAIIRFSELDSYIPNERCLYISYLIVTQEIFWNVILMEGQLLVYIER